MSSQQGAQGPPPGVSTQKGPPYAPLNAGLGGSPTILPDVPVAVVFMVLYLVFGIIHIKIFKSNKHRGHKFVFNGAILGLCKVRIITMILRMAWANYPRDVSLAIAANIFTYAGTIILYMVNWFFAQRVIRAQHPSIGWSTMYRIFHRTGLVLLIVTLLGLIISQIWKFFTLDKNQLQAFDVLFLVSQTYSTVFCFAPAILVTLSLLVPRTEVEKFGAGRLRYNITILIIAVFVLSLGQVFRCVLAWIPETPMIDVQRGVVEFPWYLSKASFYCFNFLTEIFVVMLFAISRVDLRFYVPNGASKVGDYSRSRLDLQPDDEKNIPGANVSRAPMTHSNDSNETLHRYQSSVFDDTQTLADSLRYPHSTLEVDEKTGNWKVKRLSTDSSKTRHTSMSLAKSSQSTLYGGSSSRSTPHTSFSKPPQLPNPSANSLNDRNSHAASDTPPVPELPAEWPLTDAGPLRTSHLSKNGLPHRPVVRKQTFELEGHELNHVDIGDAVTDALAKLEMNSQRTKFTSPITPPPVYGNGKSAIKIYRPSGPIRSSSGQASPKKSSIYSVYPPGESATRSRANSNPIDSPRYSVPMTTSTSASSSSKQPPAAQTLRSSRSQSTHGRPALSQSPSLEIISLLNHMSSDQSRIIDASLLREPAAAATTHLQRSPMLLKDRNSNNLNANATNVIHASTSNERQRPRQQQQQQQQQPQKATLFTPERGLERAKTQTSSNYSHDYSPSSSTNSRDNEWAAEEFRKFSSEAALRVHHSP